MSIEIEASISEYLEKLCVAFNARYAGLKENALGGQSPMDEWVCIFSKSTKASNFEFFTGVGLRHAPSLIDKRRAESGYQGLSAKDKRGLTNYGRRYLADVEKLRKPKAPCSASVLCSLILDASSNSFEEWCSEFGYDSDSRKALDTYLACQKNYDKLTKIFSQKEISDIQTLLQDY